MIIKRCSVLIEFFYFVNSNMNKYWILIKMGCTPSLNPRNRTTAIEILSEEEYKGDSKEISTTRFKFNGQVCTIRFRKIGIEKSA